MKPFKTGFYMMVTMDYLFQYACLNPLNPDPLQQKRSTSKKFSYHWKMPQKMLWRSLNSSLVPYLPFSFFLEDHNPNKTSFICLELTCHKCSPNLFILLSTHPVSMFPFFNSFQFSAAKMELFVEIVNGWN